MSLLKVAGTTATSGQLYVNDVFSVYLYTGNSSTQTITNGIDLAGKGGLVWIKDRTQTWDHLLVDSARGNGNALFSNTTSASTAGYGVDLASNGFDLTSGDNISNKVRPYVSWTFRKAAKFFDIVTWTGDGTNFRQISHNLGSAPGFMITKKTSGADAWWCYHRSLGNSTGIALNTSDEANYTLGTYPWGVTSTTFQVSSSYIGTNVSGQTYVAYLFAHDTSSTGIIQCGSVTVGETINLGWEPQYLLMKRIDAAGNWYIDDVMRGLPAVSTNDNPLLANTSSAEPTGYAGIANITATGFTFNANGTAIYMAIRRPNKPPTSGTQVFMPIAYNGVGTAGQVISDTGFSPDFVLAKARNTDGGFHQTWMDKLRGGTAYIFSDSTSAEGNTAGHYIRSFNMNGVTYGSPYGDYTNSSYTYVGEFFKRAPGFFDEVCYTGDGRATENVAHNLQTIPELVITKRRDSPQYWFVDIPNGHNKTGQLHLSDAWFQNWSSNPAEWYVATSTTVRKAIDVSGGTYVAYLFATLAGISKVGSYTGNGTGQAIACGFSAGARFVLIKRTDATGDWYTFDSARGLTSGSSPYLLLNSTAAEVTGNNGVYASTGGFTLDATAITTTNIATATYIFLAVA